MHEKCVKKLFVYNYPNYSNKWISRKLFILISCASFANGLFKMIKLFIPISCIVQWIC